MNKVLIISVDNEYDTLMLSSTISSLIMKYKNCSITLLTTDKLLKSASMIANVSEIVSIDTAVLHSVYNSSIYPKSFSINYFLSILSRLQSNKFDQVLCYGKSHASKYLLGYFSKSSEVIGQHYTTSNVIKSTHKWSIVANDVIDNLSYSPFNEIDLRNKILNLDYNPSYKGFVTQKKHDITAHDTLEKIRRSMVSGERRCRLIGIQVTDQSNNTDLSLGTIINLVREMKKDRGLYPILLIEPSQSQRDAANSIGKRFNNTISIVESDYISRPSLLKEIDLLVTPQTKIKNVAHMVGTPTVEIASGASQLFRYNSYIDGDIIIATDLLNDDTANNKFAVQYNDILDAIYCRLGEKRIDKTQFTESLSIYSVKIIDNEVFYYRGDNNPEGDIATSRLVSNALIKSIVDDVPMGRMTLDYISEHSDSTQLQEWIDMEESHINNCYRHLLHTISAAIQLNNNKQKSAPFIKNLEILLSHCDSNGLVKIPALILQSTIDSIKEPSLKDNLKIMENELYTMKSNLNKYKSILSKLRTHNIVTRIHTSKGRDLNT